VAYEVLDRDDVKIRLYGDTALATGRTTVKGKDQQGAIDQQQRWICVFLRRDGRRQLVHSQATPVQKP
jgi:ketosteroid isomerase-like protein